LKQQLLQEHLKQILKQIMYNFLHNYINENFIFHNCLAYIIYAIKYIQLNEFFFDFQERLTLSLDACPVSKKYFKQSSIGYSLCKWE